MRARILPCLEGEALDLSWAQQSWGQPSWVSCARCSGGTFTLWRDTRPALSDVDSPKYMQLMKVCVVDWPCTVLNMQQARVEWRGKA